MKVVIEIPKGDGRRWHLRYDKFGFVDLGPIKDVIPVNDGVMPVHYGYIPETRGRDEGEEIDVLVLSDNVLEVGQEVEVLPVALMLREDEDDKIVAVDETRASIRAWGDIPEGERESIAKFFSCHHKFKSIEDAEAARRYVEDCRIL